MDQAQSPRRILSFARPVAAFAGLTICIYLLAILNLGIQPFCSELNCSANSVEVTLFRSLPPMLIPLAGICGWILQLTLMSRGSLAAIDKGFAVSMAIVALGLITIQGFGRPCIWCYAHTMTCVVSAILSICPAKIQYGPIATLSLSTVFGLGLALLTPVDITARKKSLSIDTLPYSVLEQSGVFLKGKHRASSKLVAVMDLNCGHCKNWLQRALSNESGLTRSFLIIWSQLGESMDEFEGSRRDNNAIADAIAGDYERLFSFLQSGCSTSPAGGTPLEERASNARLLFQRLQLSSTPHFEILREGRVDQISGVSAHDYLFGK